MQGGLRAFAKRVVAVPRFPSVQVRRMAGEPGAREKALLAEDPALKEFQSTKGTIQMIKRFGDVLVMAVVAGSVYEIYWRVEARSAARAEEAAKTTV
ncbi:hypothetical protein MPTK1_6g18520 [Marchantia polymorpha subsp. ruderalis]|uniref:Uncharacterized protein n=2 Tax=Marchantia polymorpha TaxID=3197 RepID=A0A176VG82_MARPO|nr:hypothetical protein AXG93_698s1210 [Marchantia polymorpha subsp. ruderalis]PTQ40725.1 hypothetical protein MARPO_0038s0062 [Marchantia polymorpha]BBN15292.1 hypothetical protein Mp_6g18520 [Marchantia polymorpha subsp. ruderalis]|eukprot:PTQ40725.1 hypothetical protein MARPO_0038s0062 [Marchantia polymorpha]